MSGIEVMTILTIRLGSKEKVSYLCRSMRLLIYIVHTNIDGINILNTSVCLNRSSGSCNNKLYTYIFCIFIIKNENIKIIINFIINVFS